MFENNPTKPDESDERQETNEAEQPDWKTDDRYRLIAGYVWLGRQSFLFSPIYRSAKTSEVAFASGAGANT
jgi:hypothetical protein